jgi:hypothetical protein
MTTMTMMVRGQQLIAVSEVDEAEQRNCRKSTISVLVDAVVVAASVVVVVL